MAELTTTEILVAGAIGIGIGIGIYIVLFSLFVWWVTRG